MDIGCTKYPVSRSTQVKDSRATIAKDPEVKERNIRIPVQVTEAEKRKFEKLAEGRYTTLSELIRQLLHREADLKPQAGA